MSRKATKVTTMEEAGFTDTPGPEYKITDTSVFKRRNMSVKF